MSLKQFKNTLTQIRSNNHINRKRAAVNHIFWQLRKLFNLFPFKIKISNSVIVAEDKNCGVCALANSIGMYDYNIMNLIKLLSQKEKVFFDVGANIGLYSLLASESEFVNVIAFEPHPSTFLQLKNNIRLNDRKNINIQKLALSNVNGKAKFTNLKESSVNHFTDGISEPFVEVNAVRGDDLCNELNLIPSFIKIDVEGFEYEVLHGFGTILSKIKLILLDGRSSIKLIRKK